MIINSSLKKFFIIIFFVLMIFGCKHSEETFQRSEIAMDTVITLRAVGENSEVAIDKSFERIFELEKIIERDKKKIEDAAGGENFVSISPEVFEMLEAAQNFSEMSGGDFDITVGAAVEFWENCRQTKKFPTDAEISAVKNLTGYRHLQLDKKNFAVKLDLVGMKINFGGIAKGYGADEVRKIFSTYKISDGLIDFGSSTIFAIGEKRIGVKNPLEKNKIAEIVTLNNETISTSGDYEKFFIVEGRKIHHIINPKTCEPVSNKFRSVSVIIAGSSMTADILSTTIFVAGENIFPNLNARIIFQPSTNARN